MTDPLVLHVDPAGRVVWANGGARDFLGRALPPGTALADIVVLPEHLSDLAGVLRRSFERARAGQPLVAHNRWRDGRGVARDVLVTGGRVVGDGVLELSARPLAGLTVRDVPGGRTPWRDGFADAGRDAAVVVLVDANCPAAGLRRSLDSVAASSLPPSELFVVCAGPAPDWLAGMVAPSRILTAVAGGCALGGVAGAARADWLCFLPAGQTFAPDKLAEVAARVDPATGLIHHRVRAGAACLPQAPAHGLLPDAVADGGWRLDGFAPAAGIAVRRSVAAATHTADRSAAAAVAALCHVAALAGRVAWIDRVLAAADHPPADRPSPLLVPSLNAWASRAGAALAFDPAPDRRLERWRDRHAGRRAFIIGTGPSLIPADLERLRGELCFSCNRIFLAFDQTGWRPDYYAITDSMVAARLAPMVATLDFPKFVCASVAAELGAAAAGMVPVGLLPAPQSPSGDPDIRFSTDALMGFYGGYTVIYFLLQLAFFMGVREAVLLGIDFAFSHGQPTGGHSVLGEALLTQSGERNHFHPGYRPDGEQWTVPRLDGQRVAFARARQAFEAAGGRLLNASRQTRLDVVPRVDLDDLLAAPLHPSRATP